MSVRKMTWRGWLGLTCLMFLVINWLPELASVLGIRGMSVPHDGYESVLEQIEALKSQIKELEATR